jgi:sugar phosphate isomerase/epimerase
MIQVGCCSFDFGWLSLDESLKLIADIGFDHADIGAHGPSAQVNQEEAATEPDRKGAEIRAACEAHGLRPAELFLCWLHVDGKPVDLNHPEPELRTRALEQFRGLCACAHAAGCRSVMGVPGKVQEEIGAGTSWDVAAGMMRVMVEIAAENDVRLHVEPHMGSIIETPELALKMAQEVPGLSYTLDYSHFVAQRIDPREVDPLLHHAGHMHGKPSRPGYVHCPVHESTIDFAPIVTRLKEIDWDGVISMECIGALEDGRPTYRAIDADYKPDPLAPGILGSPVAQNVVLAHQIASLIHGE